MKKIILLIIICSLSLCFIAVPQTKHSSDRIQDSASHAKDINDMCHDSRQWRLQTSPLALLSVFRSPAQGCHLNTYSFKIPTRENKEISQNTARDFLREMIPACCRRKRKMSGEEKRGGEENSVLAQPLLKNKSTQRVKIIYSLSNSANMFDTGLLRAQREIVLTFDSHKGFKLYKASLRCAVGYNLNSRDWKKKNDMQQLLNVHVNPEVERKDEIVIEIEKNKNIYLVLDSNMSYTLKGTQKCATGPLYPLGQEKQDLAIITK